MLDIRCSILDDLPIRPQRQIILMTTLHNLPQLIDRMRGRHVIGTTAQPEPGVITKVNVSLDYLFQATEYTHLLPSKWSPRP